MKVVAIIQARMSSSRLPGKVLLNLAGRPILEHVIVRLSLSKTIDEVVVATSTDDTDDTLVAWLVDFEANFFRGSLLDVLDRYYKCAVEYQADWVVRITSDCPLVDPDIVDHVVVKAINENFDLYGLAGEFPDGLDVQVFKFDALKAAWAQADKPFEREHVGTYIECTNPDQFKVGGAYLFRNLGHMRWTLDEKADLIFLRKLMSYLSDDIKSFRTKDILEVINKHPELLKINSNIVRNEGLLKSISDWNKKVLN